MNGIVQFDIGTVEADSEALVWKSFKTMPDIYATLRDLLLEPTSGLWTGVYRQLVHEDLTAAILRLIDSGSATRPSSWEALDAVRDRRHVIGLGVAFWNRCADGLVLHLNALNDGLEARSLSKLGKNAMRGRLFNLVPAIIQRPESGAVVAENPFPAVWRLVGHALARRIDARNRPAVNDAEWLLMNELSLAGFFSSCQMPKAKLAGMIVTESMRSLLPVRGSFVRIVEFCSTNGIEDVAPPLSRGQGNVTLLLEGDSSLLAATALESRQIPIGRGMLHELIPVHDDTDVAPAEWGRVSLRQLWSGRDAVFRLYEYTMLSYLGLSSIEFLLRGRAAQLGIPHVKATGAPNGVLDWVASVNLSPAVMSDVQALYDATQSNIRNRVMHGNLLEIEAKGTEARMYAGFPNMFPMLGNPAEDAYSPQNTAHLCLDVLQALDAEVARHGGLADQDMNWVADVSLTRQEVEFGLGLSVDFLSDDRLQWHRTVSDYLNATLPCIKQLFTIGFIGWLRGPIAWSLPRFMALGFTFEAIYRVTAHLLGESVVQVNRMKGRPVVKSQYRMLDGRPSGLANRRVLSRLVEHVEREHQETAIRVLQLAIKARNALAHGAVPELGGEDADGWGHLLVKAVQTLITRGLEHLVSECAYYRWKNVRKESHGFDVEDWGIAEQETYRRVFRVSRVMTGAVGASR